MFIRTIIYTLQVQSKEAQFIKYTCIYTQVSTLGNNSEKEVKIVILVAKILSQNDFFIPKATLHTALHQEKTGFFCSE